MSERPAGLDTVYFCPVNYCEVLFLHTLGDKNIIIKKIKIKKRKNTEIYVESSRSEILN